MDADPGGSRLSAEAKGLCLGYKVWLLDNRSLVIHIHHTIKQRFFKITERLQHGVEQVGCARPPYCRLRT